MYKKKSLGQHFLSNPHYLGLIADTVEIKAGETVVEIGPGEGTLTAELLKRGAKVIALEKDSRLIDFLKEKFAGQDIEVIEGDALDYEPPKTYKVVGNIPYYISGALFKKFLTEKNQPSTLVFLVQKEVAERIARSKKESILSLSVKAYGEPKYIKTVPSGAFAPPPKVDSAILAVRGISRDNFKNAAHEKNFFELVKKAFGQKRKMLHSTIGIDSNERPEDLALAEWLILSA
ncbi:MAG: 16S rRNA (adenine(1518)-N(6)/adenine(1519)-N(6))-dimethyltransferase RsmA [Patescibacteria group bacterium]